MKVANLIPRFVVGGIEQFTLDLSIEAARIGVESCVAAFKDGPMSAEMKRAGLPVLAGPGAMREAIRWADLVNLHWGAFSEPWHDYVARSGKPYVTTLHGAVKVPRLPAVTICTSETVYRMQPNRDRCVCIPNGLDLSRFRAQSRKTDNGSGVVIRVCRTERCALYFWTAMHRALAEHKGAELWIVGNDDGAKRLGRVRFFGIRRDVPELLAQADIFAYAPYKHIGTRDLVAMEACAAGLPAVVSDTQSVQETIEHGVNGFRVPYGDADGFAEKVGELIEDADLRRRMGEASWRLARERCDIRDVAARYVEVYRRVLADRA